jgi:site-specific recombinase XerD
MALKPLDVECPTCFSGPGRRCIDPRTRHRKRPLRAPEPHVRRLWPTRPCPKCKAFPGESCRTPSGRVRPTPHTARVQLTREESARYLAKREAATAAARERQREAQPATPLALDAGDDALPAAVQLDEGVDVRASGSPPPLNRSTALESPTSALLLDGKRVDLADAMRGYAQHAQAPNTTRAYAADWRAFTDWTQQRELRALPADPQTVALYLTAIAQDGLRLATVRRRAAAIGREHRAAGHPSPLTDPAVKTVIEGISRTHGAPARKKVALDRDTLLAVVAAIDTTTTAGLRDRALLLVGFALALRRSELVAIAVEDLAPHPDGMLVTLNRSKSDQHGRGHTFLLAHSDNPGACPVTALQAWIAHAQLTEGPLARRISQTGRVLTPLSAQSIALIIRRRVQAAALAGVSVEDFAGHSLRSGFATQAARDGYSTAQIRHVTRHRDPRTLDGYIQAGTGAKDLARVL